MANIDHPNGAIPIGTVNGSPWNGKGRVYPVDASNATAIFKGDFVILEDDGHCAPAPAGGNVLGVCVGVVYDRSVAATEHPGYLPATTAGSIIVVDSPDMLFEIQEDGNMGTAVIGSNGDIVAGAGSTTTGVSAHELDSSDVTTNDGSAASAQLRVVGYVDRADNDPTLSNGRWIVMINEHQLNPQQVGI